ncbi:Sir2 family transcriptional regulator [Rubrivivax gelatinosus]|uniref:SIR2 family NAD-dependent protein deacylase n=1 Tax=Rubrivivax gelatinosus TaxID=28068 RepID=UPI001906C177|nr:NAD-dependent deacylase [Rubrivivax gelatinosus]MBK1615075.1 Sir2 family transcriptional regulator [Rubrivivax gelatinosus]
MAFDFTRYRRIVVLTGAGISAASGLRTFRGPGGIWDDAQVAECGHVATLRARPQRTWALFGAMREPVAAARPNAAHRALAQFEARLQPEQDFLLITQNIDGLHQQAGSRRVVELHGNLRTTRCSEEGCTLEPFADDASYAAGVPRCRLCGGVLRPDIVLFGEMLPMQALSHVQQALQDCDLFIAVGTSGTVTPAAEFVRAARYAGAHTVYLNLEPMRPRHPAFAEELLGPAEELLPRWLGTA